MLQILIPFFLIAFSQASSGHCGKKVENQNNFYSMNICNTSGQVVGSSRYFADTNQLSQTEYYDSRGRVILSETYSKAGDKTKKTITFTKSSKTVTTYAKNSSTQIVFKQETDLETNRVLKRWGFSENGEPLYIDTFTNFTGGIGRQIEERKFLSNKHKKHTYQFIYKPVSRYHDEIESFKIFDAAMTPVGQYVYNFGGDVEALIRQQYVGKELTEKLASYQNHDRLPVAIIDSGFDIRHPAITAHLANPKEEKWGSTDNDNNGIAGDIFGFSYDTDGKVSANINEPVITGSLKPVPASHGTHVSSIAVKNQDKIALLGYSGDVSNPQYIDMVSKELTAKKIRLANMSWGFKEQGAPFTPGSESYRALKDMISQNHHTLMFVASGNNGWNIDTRHKDYPASYRFNNLLVIGALNVPDYNFKNGRNLKPAVFKNNTGSNVGEISVDAFAPGKNVNGAALGGGMIRKSGTSMASPFALNSTTELALRNLDLSSIELKEIVMKSVGFAANPLPCVSQGFVHPRRLKFIANLLAQNPAMKIEEAVNNARAKKDLFYPGEVEIEKAELASIWADIDNSLKINEP